MSYGPYWIVPSGNYEITLNGTGLENSIITISSQQSKYSEVVEFDKNDSIDNQLIICVNIPINIGDLEILVQNTGESNMTLNEIRMKAIA